MTFSNGPLGITFADLQMAGLGAKITKLGSLAKMKDIIRRYGCYFSSGETGFGAPDVIKILREASSPRELTFRDVELYNMIEGQ